MAIQTTEILNGGSKTGTVTTGSIEIPVDALAFTIRITCPNATHAATFNGLKIRVFTQEADNSWLRRGAFSVNGPFDPPDPSFSPNPTNYRGKLVRCECDVPLANGNPVLSFGVEVDIVTPDPE